MPEESKESYPMLSQKSWWLLRIIFKRTIPRNVDSLYLKTVLKISKESAANNVLPYLKDIGLIDKKGKPQPLANQWRDDNEYSKVCEEIKKNIYPADLLDAIPDPVSERKATKEWFKSKTGVGENAAKKMAGFYDLLCKANVEDEKRISKPSEKLKEVKPKKLKKDKAEEKKKAEEPKDEKPRDEETSTIQFPAIHLNVQIHLTSDASTNQIDQLFSSIAKHLKEFFPKKSK